MANPHRRGPRVLSEILGELFTARGYGRLRAAGELEEAWNAAVGEPHCRATRLGEVRHGVLTVVVAHPALLGELAAFRKPELLRALRAGAPGTTIHDIRFRVGPIDGPAADDAGPGIKTTAAPEAAPARRRGPRARPKGGRGAR
jgi:predicted nucleic acid-binding Zn ribbon protein